VPELAEYVAAFGVDGVCDFFPASELRGGEDAWDPGVAAGLTGGVR
jgi:hypothetical protein